MNAEPHNFFLQLVRLGIGTSKDAEIPNDINWQELKMLADEHGLSAIVLDGIDKCHAGNLEIAHTKQLNGTNTLPIELKLEWIGDVLQNYEQRYEQYKKAIGSLTGFYNRHGFKMMVLKGYACSLDWPIPEHRPCGDIDIWQFGQYKAADTTLTKERGIEIDKSHHHHTVFYWGDFMVENHYDFVNVHHSKSNAEIERAFKKLGADDSNYNEIYGEKVYLPSPNLHALFLLRHAMIEFAAGGINLRQVLDWAFFVKKHKKEVDWECFKSALDGYNMREFFNYINAICVEELGFESSIFPYIQQFNPIMKERVLKDILEPEISNNMPKNMLVRLIWKCQRWKANKWKHDLCYKESMWSAFWRGVWGHLLKPTSI